MQKHSLDYSKWDKLARELSSDDEVSEEDNEPNQNEEDDEPDQSSYCHTSEKKDEGIASFLGKELRYVN